MAIDQEVCLKRLFPGVYSFIPTWEEFYDISYNDGGRIWVMSLNDKPIRTFWLLRDAREWLYNKYAKEIA